MRPIVTERSTVGKMISEMARSTARGTTLARDRRSERPDRLGLMMQLLCTLANSPWSAVPPAAQHSPIRLTPCTLYLGAGSCAACRVDHSATDAQGTDSPPSKTHYFPRAGNQIERGHARGAADGAYLREGQKGEPLCQVATPQSRGGAALGAQLEWPQQPRSADPARSVAGEPVAGCHPGRLAAAVLLLLLQLRLGRARARVEGLGKLLELHLPPCTAGHCFEQRQKHVTLPFGKN